jgi:hypothetical protein
MSPSEQAEFVAVDNLCAPTGAGSIESIKEYTNDSEAVA